MAKLLRIYGLVQGVGYREAMRREAERLNLTGWARNCRNGTVEALVSGHAEQVELIVEWAKQGPRFAMVERVLVTDAGKTESNTFEILFSD
jgi:acylphosphatase